jgi:Mg-chelatase subunit ChlD
MNFEQPSREEIEARITALLLGELPADEATLLRYTIAQDAGLQKLRDELAATMALVREVEKKPADGPADKPAPLQLPAERRQKLLTHFKTPRPKVNPEPLFWLKPIPVRPVVVVLSVIAIIGLAAVCFMPVLSAGKRSASRGQYGAEESLGTRLTDRIWSSDNAKRDAMTTSPTSVSTNFLVVNSDGLVAATPELQPPPLSLPKATPSAQIVLPELAAENTAQTGPAAENENRPGQAQDAATFSLLSKDGKPSTVAAPVVAAPPAQLPAPSASPVAGIVLPASQMEAGSQVTEDLVAQTRLGAAETAPGNAGLGQPATSSQNRGGQPVVGVVNAFAGAGGFHGGVGGGGGGGGGQPSPNVTTLADKHAIEYSDGLTSSSPTSGSGNPFVSRYAFIAPTPAMVDQQQTTNVVVQNSWSGKPWGPSAAAIVPNGTYAVNGKEVELFTVKKTAPTGGAQNTPAESGLAANKKEQADAQGDLEQKREMHQLLSAKLEAEKLDLNLPKSNLVQLTEPAQPGRSQNLWQRLTGQVESKARIKIESDRIDIPGLSGSAAPVEYGGYFPQTTLEIIRSELVLSNVVAKLDLQSAWAPKNGGQKLTVDQAVAQLRGGLDLRVVPNTKLIEIGATSSDPTEAARLANAVAEAYGDYRSQASRNATVNGVATLESQYAEQDKEIQVAQAEVDRLTTGVAPARSAAQTDLPLRKPGPNAPLPQPEVLASSNAFSTFSLNVSDVSFKLAEASLQNGRLPDAAAIRSEEFINAFDYRDPEAAAGQAMAFTSERARYPFAHNRELLRFAIKTAAAGRQQGRALNLVLLLDRSGSMERADRVAIIREALRVLATQLQPQDTVSVVTFARTARLWADGVRGNQAGETLAKVGSITPEGGTNLEEAMRLAYETARRHYLANGINRVVLLTDGAANLGNVDPDALKHSVEAQRKQGIALDCFGIGWEDYNDDLLEQLSSNGDGRYAFLNSPEEASKDFAAKLAGALQIAAADVKVQVEFNPARVTAYRQIGYATHQLTKEQFRDNTVAAGQIAAQEAGNALYTIAVNPRGEGPIATVHVRYRIPGTQDYREHSWDVAYTGTAPALERASAAMRLAATASAFSEWLAASPYAQEVTLDALLKELRGVPEIYGADDRPKQLDTMIREAKSLAGK